MNSRSYKLLLPGLLGLVAVWLCWPHSRPAAVPFKLTAGVPAAPTAVNPPAALVAASASSLAATNAAASSLKGTNKFALRLTNTTKSLHVLAHDTHAILLANALIDTRSKLNFKLPKNLKSTGDPGAYVVQANGTISANFRAMLAANGAQIVSYIPNNAYLVRASAGEAAAITSSGLAAAVLPYEPYYKIASGLLAQATAQQPLTTGQTINLGVFADAAATVEQQLNKLGVPIVAQDQSPFGPIFRVQPPAGADWTVYAQWPGVQTLEPAFGRKTANDLGRVSVGVSADTLTSTNYLNLYGSNIIVEMNDSGVDQTHPDFTLVGGPMNGPGTGTRIFGDSLGSLTDTDGHGTHVAGIIAGNGAESWGFGGMPMTNVGVYASGSISNADFRGKAPLASIFSVAFLGNDPVYGAASSVLTPSISDMSDYYLQATPALTNALISNNSWTYGGDNAYDLAAASYDAAVRDALPMQPGMQPVLFVFAAGNDGGGNDDGSGANADTIESPSTAKNVITVGALEQLRNITNIVTDAEGNSNAVWQPETDSDSQVAGFSARGNVGINVEGDAGRFKPDVVAPGTFVVSTRSGQWDQQAYYDPTNYYTSTAISQIVFTNSINIYYLVVPPNAVGVNINVYPNAQSPVPFPPNLPIWVADDGNPAGPGDFDFVTSNDVVNIPPEGVPDGPTYLNTIQQTVLSFAVGDSTNFPVNYNISATVIATNNLGNYFIVLSNLNNTLGPYYRYESGTSMATPAVSGVLALMQDFFTNQLHTVPSPALLKAMLINGARSVGNYPFAVTNAPNDQGWGLVNLPTSLPEALTNLIGNPNPPYTPFFFQDQSVSNSLATGDSQTFNVVVDPAATSLPLRVTLTWTDPPGNPAAAFKLVNNLDIIVTNLDTTNVTVYYGNDFSTAGNPSYSLAASADTNAPPNFDVVNNVRNIYLQPTLATNYSVTVFARSVNVNAVSAQSNSVVQDFALVISSGDGSVSNALTVTTTVPVRNPTADQNITFVTTTNTPLLNQIAGENSPLEGANTVGVSTNSPLATNELVTVGMTNQWHFYVVTNTLGYTNAGFITFFPMTMALPTIGVFADTEADSTRPSADIDLYVAKEPGLLNLDPTVISNCVNGIGGDAVSAGPGGTEFVAYSNSVINQVYYIGVKSEDHLATVFGFLPVFSQYPFSSINPDGSESVNGLILPQAIPDGTPKNPGVAYVFALALYPLTVDEIIETNGIQHQNFGDLFGQLSHANINDVLNNHDGYGNTTNEVPLTYYDAPANPINTPIGQVSILTPHPSDGPGSLVSYQGQPAIGPWILTEVDNAFTHIGSVTAFGLRIYPHTPAQKGLDVYISGGGVFDDYIDVPAGVTNLTLSVTNGTLPTTLPPLQVYLRFGAAPTPQPIPTLYDQSCVVSNGTAPNVGGSISVGPSSIPPINPGRYYFEVYNPSTSPATNVYIIATFGFAATHGTGNFTSTNVPTALLDDAVVTNTIGITNLQNIYAAAVGVVVQHPRVSDLTLTLVSPLGERFVLFENRGGANATNMGHLNITTNFFGTTSAGNGTGSTNVLSPVPNQGTLLVNYDFFTIPDDMQVYYGGVLIFDSGYVSNSGQFAIPYGPGSATNLTIIMDKGGEDNTTLWTYTPSVVSENYTYLTFTDDTNYAQIPIKFAIPPYDLTDLGTNYILSNFEPATNGDYLAPTNIYDLYGGWNLYTNLIVATNTASTGTNYLILTNNEVSVVTDPANAYEGSNFLTLANGTITRLIPTIPTREYTVSYSYRGPGIAGWWRGEGNATDSANPETNSNNGDLIGRFAFPAGVVGQAFGMEDQGNLYQFAGTNNYVQIPRTPSLDVGTGDGFTVEGWINPSNLATQEPLVEWLSRMPTNPVVTNIVILAGPFLNRGTGHFYYLLGETNWTTSEKWATNMGGHLVTINDANEQNWVYDTFANYAGTNHNLWIGLNDAANPAGPRYVWSSGETPLYANWGLGQPTNCSGGDFYTVILGSTNAEPGQWRLEENNGDTCGVTGEKGAYGVAELDIIPTNGVQFWISVTNSPVTGNGTANSNGCLYACLIDITNGVHEIWSAPGLVQSNYYQHVALTYSTNTGFATLYYEGTNVCATNLGVFVPKTTGDVLLGKDMTTLTNNYFSGSMDEMSIYRRTLSDAEIFAIYNLSTPSTNGYPTNGTYGTVGKFDPAYNPALSLAEAVVTLGSRTNLILGDNTNWQRVSYTFIADTNETLFQFTGTEPGMLLDDFTVSESALGDLYYQPEQPLSDLVGESAAGIWTLEIQDNRANNTNPPAQLVSWQLQFVLQTNSSVPITLSPETPATNTVPPGRTAYFYVPIPNWAGYATNILVSATAPVSLLFNPTNLPTGSSPNDLYILGSATAGTTGGTPPGDFGKYPPLNLNYLQTNTLPLTTNYYYLGVQNNGTVPSTFVVEADFNLTLLTNGVPLADTLRTNATDTVRYYAFDVSSNNPVEATFQLLKLTGNASLVVNYGSPLPSLGGQADYGSFNSSNVDQSIYVQTNSAPVPLAPGRWYLGVFRNTPGPISYSILAKELDAGQTNIITLTNNVPFNFTAGPGAALTNFFCFPVTNAAPEVHFVLHNLTGNGDLTVQSNALPLAPPFYTASLEPGEEPEYVYLRTNSNLTNLNANWYLGVPSHETNVIHYTIMAVNESLLFSNTVIPAFPGATGAGVYTSGGHGSTNIYHVINLDDDGPGSLRYGVNSLTNSGNILFDVSGNIALQSPLVITNSNLTIAGQTAPGDGITLQNYPTLLDGANNVIIRYLRFRPGDTGTNLAMTITNLTPGDSLAFTNAFNVIIDHVSASWSTNAVMEVLNSSNITVQWSLIADSFYGTNGMTNYLPGSASILRYGNGSLSFNHNLYANNYVSSPEMGDNLTVDFVNNVVYNWGLLPGWSLTNDPVMYPNSFTNYLNYACNYVIATTNTMTNYIAFWGNSSNTWIFQTNNFIDSSTNYAHVVAGVTNFTLEGAPTGWGMFTNLYTPFGEPFPLPYPDVANVTLPGATAVTVPTATAEEAYLAYERVLDFAGDQLNRDRVDLHLIRDVRHQTNVDFILSQSQVGGWPSLNTVPGPLDTDQDGIPDYWEITFGLNPTNAADGANIVTNTGYTELETYLNWLAGPHALTLGTNSVAVDLYHLSGQTGRLTFFVTNALNGSVYLTNQVYTNYVFTNNMYVGMLATNTNSLAIFTPTNGYTSSFTNPASFDFYVTNHDTVAWFGPVTVSVVVANTNFSMSPTIITLTNGVPFTVTADPVYQFVVTNSPGTLVFQVYNLTNPAAMVVQTNSLPVAPDYFATSATPASTNAAQIVVQTNLALANIGAVNLASLNQNWYFTVTNSGSAISNYTVLVQSVPVAPTVINLTNNVPFTFTAGPGPDLTNFYRFSVSDSPAAVQFQLYNQSGNCDLTVQTNALPYAPEHYLLSQQPGSSAELIQMTTNNGGPASLNSQWFLGVPNNDPGQNTYTILAQELPSLSTGLPGGAPQTNVVAGGGVTYYLVDVPPNATLATNILVSATGPVNLWFSTNNPPTIGNPDDALLLNNSTGGFEVFGTNATAELIGTAQFNPGGFYYLAVENDNSYAVTNIVEVNFSEYVTPVTAPVVTTLAATSVSPFSATLNATVVPDGAPTTVWFAYGLTTNYTGLSAVVRLTNSLFSTFPVAVGIAGLLPGSIYHFEAIATNSVGTNYGGDLTFTNLPAAPTVTTVAATGVSSSGATFNASVNPNGAAATVYFEYGTTTSYGQVTGVTQLTGSLNTSQPVASGVSGLLPGVKYHFQAIGTNVSGTNFGGDLTVTTPPAAPTVTTVAATAVTSAGATLHATVNPNGAAATVYFEYGTTTSYGQLTSVSQLTGSLNTAQPVTKSITGLLPGVTYHFQAIGTNVAGTGFGGDLTFITPPAVPTVTTLAATAINPTSATLNSLVNPNGAPATVYFAYGTTTNYGSFTSSNLLSGSLNTAQPVSLNISGLVPDVTYHFKAFASNSAGVSYGVDRKFVTITQPINFSSIIATNNGYLLSWYAPTNYQFKVQWILSLATTNWQVFNNLIVYTGPVTPTNGLFTFFDDGSQTAGFGTLRFYRLNLLPMANDNPPVLPVLSSIYYVNPETTLVVTNTATDSNPLAILTYNVSGTLTGTNLPAVGTNGVVTWTPTLTQAGLTNTITTIVTDNGVVPLSSTNTFLVVVNQIPYFSSVQVTSQGVTLRWVGALGNQYQIGWTTNLLSPWTYVPPSAPFLNSATTNFFYQDTNAATGNKFYRLLQLP